MKFEAAKFKKHNRYCDHKTTHGNAKSAQWVGTWLGWPMGQFCHECKAEWEKMYDEFR